MRHDLGSVETPGVLVPAIPADIGARTQRRRILEGMVKACAKKTFATATIADIVAGAGVSRATFYRHFSDKRECFGAAIDSFAEELKTAVVVASAGAASRPDTIQKAIATLLRLLAANPAQAKLLLIDAPIVDPSITLGHRELVVSGLSAQWAAFADEAGREQARPDFRTSFGRAHVLVASCIAAGRTKELPSLLPDLVYVALLLLVDQEEAVAQAELAR
jgi:AcrR family transcriptional regulator